MNIIIPDEVKYIIDTIESNGYDAYAVGGCIRDSLRGETPKDWDVCTSALPEEIKECFAGKKIIETGLQHGTLTLVLNKAPYEITTYRTDGKYTDYRRPDKVKFVGVLKRDLARRDFTINALAYNPKTGVVDYYGGQQDLSNGVIKCVGNPNKRFQEDALRIMRALRFASELGFKIDEDTAKAMHDSRGLLNKIAAERIAAELNKMLIGRGVSKLLADHVSIITEIIPELIPTIGFNQNSPYHFYDVYTHMLKSVESAPQDAAIRLTLLLHDIGKPSCYTEDDRGGHFYKHQQVGSEMAGQILRRLKYDNNTVGTVKQLVLYHDAEIHADNKSIKRWLNRIGEERFRKLIQVKNADSMAQVYERGEEKRQILNRVSLMLNDIIEQQLCFSLRDMAVDGRDLIDIGIPESKQIGVILNQLMNMVIDDEVDNEKENLLKEAEKLMKKV